MSTPPRDERSGTTAPGRRPYAPPRLVRYGTIVELTHGSFSPMGTLDGQVGVGKMGTAFLKSD